MRLFSKYFDKHILNKGQQLFHKPFEQFVNPDLNEIFEIIETENSA